MENKRLLYIAAFGIFLFGGGLFLGWYGIPIIVKDQVHQKVAIQNGSETYPMWVKMSIPIIFNVYFFNVLNPSEVNNGANPELKEIGPFCYNLFRDKIVLDVSEDKDSVEYYSRRVYRFTQDRPGCLSDSTEVTILNIALLGTVHIVLDMSPDLLPAIEEAIPALYAGIKNVFITASVQDLLFNGILLDCSSEEFTIGLVCQNIKGMSPPQIRQHENGRDYLFAMFDYMNGTNEGPFRVNTGVKNVSLLGYNEEWMGKKQTEFWGSEQCNAFLGSDGYIIPPVDDAQKLYFFQPDLCRSVELDFEDKSELFGIPAVKFAMGEAVLDSSPENRCYCPRVIDPETRKEHVECLKKGVINLKACFKAPVVMSWPHFYQADQSYLDYVSGLSPLKDRHENFAYVEPMTGTPLRGYKRAQINMFLIKSDEITVLSNVSEGLFPVLWIEEGAEIPADYQSMIKSIFGKLKLLDLLKPVVVLVGFGSFVSAILLYFRQNHMFCFTEEAKTKGSASKVNVLPGYREPTAYGRDIRDAYDGPPAFNAERYPRAPQQNVYNSNGNPSVQQFDVHRLPPRHADLFVSHY